MERLQRDSQGVWFPKEIWLSDQLSLIEKVLFVEIRSLDNEHGCFASNKYLSDFLGIHPRRIAAHIASLKSKGFIFVTITNRNDRVIRVVGKYARVPDAKMRRLKQEKADLVHRFGIPSRGGVTRPSQGV